MHKRIKNDAIDISRTRRLVINETCHNRQKSMTTLPKYVVSNTLNANKSHPCVVQFSKSFLTPPPVAKYSCSPILSQISQPALRPDYGRRQHFNNTNGELPMFQCHNSSQEKMTTDEDDVVFLNNLAGDCVTVKSNDMSYITINDSFNADEYNSTIMLNTSDTLPDLNKFVVVVRNTDCSVVEQDNLPEVDLDDSVIFVGSDNKEMTNTAVVPICDQKSDSNVSVITIDDDIDNSISISPALPLRRLKISKRKNKHSLIHKKKDKIGKDHIIPSTKISTKKLITLSKPMVLTAPSRKMEACKSSAFVTSAAEKMSINNYSNIYNSEPVSKTGLREIVIDGSNVALGHTNGVIYSIEGLQIVIDYFVKRGHKVRAFLPKFRLIPGRSSNPELLQKLVNDKYVILTPSRSVMGKRINSYDDRFIIEYATLCEGIIVSSDCYKDLLNEKPGWRSTIEDRLLMPTWIDNILMFPEDPLGRFGPNLTEFLKFPTS